MISVTEEEARELLSSPLLLEGPCEFFACKQRPWHHTIEQGLLRTDGTRAGLLAKIEHVIAKSTHLRTFQFSVFRSQLGGPQRVYQLTVTSSKRPMNDLHQLSHEHFGTLRSEPQPQWASWTFEQAMSYFCERCCITIDPPIDNPETLRLR